MIQLIPLNFNNLFVDEMLKRHYLWVDSLASSRNASMSMGLMVALGLLYKKCLFFFLPYYTVQMNRKVLNESSGLTFSTLGDCQFFHVKCEVRFDIDFFFGLLIG